MDWSLLVSGYLVYARSLGRLGNLEERERERMIISGQMIAAGICGLVCLIMAITEKDRVSVTFWASVIVAILNFGVVALDLMGYLE